MEKMRELYEKVAGDSALQAKFAEIMQDGGTAEEKLTAFAKEAGYDVTVEEIQNFFKGLAESKEGALSDAELDQAAGGKSENGNPIMIGSVISLGLNCAIGSVSGGAVGPCNAAFT
jgi:predicted ribosomally synthesized peptide with nif11-like leader